DAKKFAEMQPKKEKAPKEPKEPKPQEKKEKKEEKKKPAPEEEPDACDEVLSSEPKAKDPFAPLPKSARSRDEGKRQYSNAHTLSVALPHGWEQFA
ncbi:hypothetical protein KFY57_28410, partial [Salmonella enterica subsp. enterica serovar Typhimurium]|nr:hypothetical protein [Salmonella enterica subsp. enterica serovar Typhimurium]